MPVCVSCLVGCGGQCSVFALCVVVALWLISAVVVLSVIIGCFVFSVCFVVADVSWCVCATVALCSLRCLLYVRDYQ